MDKVQQCDEHGYFTGSSCPNSNCDLEPTMIMNGEQRYKLTSFIAWALRHEPEKAGIEIDERGWADAYELSEQAKGDHPWVTPEKIASIVSIDDENQFVVNGDMIRATSEHSIDIEEVPETLYYESSHGPGEVLDEGLPIDSQSPISLTTSLEEALTTAQRLPEKQFIYKINTTKMTQSIEPESEFESYTVESVPAKHIELLESTQ